MSSVQMGIKLVSLGEMSLGLNSYPAEDDIGDGKQVEIKIISVAGGDN